MAATAAVAAMIAAGDRRIAEVAVIADSPAPVPPCGGCRQRIAEFADGDTVILAIDDSGEWQEYAIGSLLPASFHLP